jgi:predicted PurR-regulated permease PerM
MGLLYLFLSPLVSSAVHFGKEIPDLIKSARKGHGPLGELVFRLHLQKYLSEGSAKLTKQLTKVLKPATALSVGAAALSDLVTIGAIAVLTFFTMLESPRLWNGFLGMFRPSTSVRLERVINESIRSVSGYMLGNFLTSAWSAGRHWPSSVFRSPSCWAPSWLWWICSRWSGASWPGSPWSSSPPFTRSRPAS